MTTRHTPGPTPRRASRRPAARPARLWALLLAVVLLLPAGAAAADAAVGSTAARTEVAAARAPSGVTATRGSLTNRRRIDRLGGAPATLRKVRVGRHAGFDRVVFEFEGGLPGYSVRYVPVARTDGAGAPIPTLGTVALQVYLEADSVDLDRAGFPLTFTPPGPLTPRYPTLRQVRYGGFFEGGTTFAAGLKGRSGFRVLELAGPSRLAIDVAHGATLRTLRKGHRGPDVRDWQRRLNVVQFGPFASTRGHAQGRLTADGVFGPATVRATRALQRAEGVDVTGVVNGATRNALYRALRRSAQVSS